MSSTVAQLFEHSSRQTPDGNANPYWLLLRTMEVASSDIAHVVRVLGDLRTLAENMDERLRPVLMKDVNTFIESLISLTSVGGKGLKYLTTQTQAYHFIEKSGGASRKMSMREMVEGQNRKEPVGIRVPDE